MVSSSTPGSSKRSRARSGGNSVACCLVDGCVSDLSKCREYHRRHKVCEVHSKTATVMVGGREQRFCQQCSRFHQLVEFDDVKRSCRKRLEGHNRRRRKPQLHSLNFGTYMANQQGALFTSYADTFPTNTLKSDWAPFVKVEDVPVSTPSSARHHHLLNDGVDYEHFPVSSHGIICKDDKKFPFVQENVLISDCAHSLLSSPKAQNVTYGGDRNSIPQPLITCMKYDGILNCQNLHENLGPMSISDSNNVDLSCHGLFRVEGEEFSDGDPHNLSIPWQ